MCSAEDLNGVTESIVKSADPNIDINGSDGGDVTTTKDGGSGDDVRDSPPFNDGTSQKALWVWDPFFGSYVVRAPELL